MKTAIAILGLAMLTGCEVPIDQLATSTPNTSPTENSASPNETDKITAAPEPSPSPSPSPSPTPTPSPSPIFAPKAFPYRKLQDGIHERPECWISQVYTTGFSYPGTTRHVCGPVDLGFFDDGYMAYGSVISQLTGIGALCEIYWYGPYGVEFRRAIDGTVDSNGDLISITIQAWKPAEHQYGPAETYSCQRQ